MLENSLKSRNKFVSKVVDKINSLKDDLNLLYKVDKKISKNILKNGNNQLGGAGEVETVDMKELHYTVHLLKKKQEALNTFLVEEALKNNEVTKLKFDELRQELKEITEMLAQIIDQINIKQRPTNSFDLQFMKWSETEMNEVSEKIAGTYLEMTKETRLRLFNDDETFFEFIKKRYGPSSPPNNITTVSDQNNIKLNSASEPQGQLRQNSTNSLINQANRLPDVTRNVSDVGKKATN